MAAHRNGQTDELACYKRLMVGVILQAARDAPHDAQARQWLMTVGAAWADLAMDLDPAVVRAWAARLPKLRQPALL